MSRANGSDAAGLDRHGARETKGEAAPSSGARVAVLAWIMVLLAGGNPAGATPERPSSWPEVKCTRYAAAWAEALKRKGARGLGGEFLERHDAFLASGCSSSVAVCPRSPEELDMANILIVASFNAGMGSTFTPFSCRK